MTAALVELHRDTWRDFTLLTCAPGQEGHCSAPTAILARAYAHRSNDAEAWGIVDDGMPVGLVMWWTLTRAGGTRWLVVDQLLIDAQHQRSGLASFALKQARWEAERRGCAGLTCCVVEGNLESEALMAKAGFVREPAHDEGVELSYILCF